MKAIALLCLIIVIAGPSTLHAGDIQPASAAQKAIIETVKNADVKLIGNGATLKSSEHQNAYWVGFIFTAQGITPQVGIWLMAGTLDSPRGVLSVDGFAKQFSRATHGDKTNPRTTYGCRDQCREVQKYLNRQLK